MISRQRLQDRVDLSAIRSNVQALMAPLPEGTKCCMVVKADGYGCGSVAVARALSDLADFFAVSSYGEAQELYEAGIDRPVLCLGLVWPEEYEEAIRHGLRFNVFRRADALQLSKAASRVGRPAYLHFKVDTGMNRLGFAPTEENIELVAELSRLPHVEAEGLFTHFAKADAADLTDAELQWERFEAFRQGLESRGVHIPLCHAANSAAAMALPQASLQMVRLGIAAYGYYPSDEMTHGMKLLPSRQLVSHVSFVKTVPAGEGIGYGYRYVTDSPRRIATVPVGYADGYSRLLSGKASVLIHGRRAPIRGSICMDQLMADVTDIPEAAADDEVVLLGRQEGEEITIEELQELSGVLHYELLCGFDRRRIPHSYITNQNTMI